MAIRGILTRPAALGIRETSHAIFVHPQRDPGCRVRGDVFLESFTAQYEHALLIFDRDGCGDLSARETIETNIEQRLAGRWGQRAAAVVIDPELENWVWADSPHVADVLGWRDHNPNLRAWLNARGLCALPPAKPADPKNALTEALREVRKPASSALFLQLAQRVGFATCTDASFLKLSAQLRSWFSN